MHCASEQASKQQSHRSTCRAAYVHCAETPSRQQAVAEPVLHSSTCARIGRMLPGPECTAQADLSLDPMQTPRVAEVAPQVEVGCISSCHQRHVSYHAWRDRELSDSMDLLCSRLYITAMQRDVNMSPHHTTYILHKSAYHSSCCTWRHLQLCICGK